jgi:hypothetical protein
MRRINSSFFTQELWRNGYIGDLSIQSRFFDIISLRGREILNEYCIGFCNGESLYFRPKINHKAIMINKDQKLFWFHIRNEEFNIVFF